MVLYLLLITVLMCSIECNLSYTLRNLNSEFDHVEDFFEKLKADYESYPPNINTFKKIDDEIALFMQNASELHLQRQKRKSHDSTNRNNNDVVILNGFDEVSSFNILDFRDLTFFSLERETGSFWFVAGINLTSVSVFEWKNNLMYQVADYPLVRGVRMIINSSSILNTPVIIQQEDGILILRLNYDRGTFIFSFVQFIEIPLTTDVCTWRDLNHLYLGVVSRSDVLIYIWLEEYFDFEQSLGFGAAKLSSFQNNGFTYLVTGGTNTVVLRFSLPFKKFVTTQILPSSQDIAIFQFSKSYSTEHYLSLSGLESTILYKEMHGRFVPFQEIPASRRIVPLVTGKASLLFSLYRDILTVYQYDGWKFMRLNTQVSEVIEVHRVAFYKDDSILIKYANLMWKVLELNWVWKKSWQSLQEETQTWCRESEIEVQRTFKLMNDTKKPIRILNGHISQLRVQNVNGDNTIELQYLIKRYRKLMLQLQTIKDILKHNTSSNDAQHLKSLHGHNIYIKCKSQCKVNRMLTNEKNSTLSKLRKIGNSNQHIKLKNLKIETLNPLRCPIPAFAIDNIFVNHSINNVSILDIEENALKISGEQVVTGEHIFLRLTVTNAFMPLDIATNFTRQTVQAREIRVRKLNIMEGQLFLPLNGPPTVVPGSIIASKVTLKGNVTLYGGIKGKRTTMLKPITEINDSMTLTGNYFFNNVKIINNFKVEDIYRTNGTSLKYILKNGIATHTDVPIHLVLSSSNVEWENITLKDHNNWITAHADNNVIISGTKRSFHNVTLTNFTYEKLPIPKLNIPLCGLNATVPDIKLSQITIDNMIVKHLNTSHMFGAQNLNSSIFEAVSSIKDANLSLKHFVGSVVVKNISTNNTAKMNSKGFQEILNIWIEPNLFAGPLELTNLSTNSLHGSLNIPIPTTVNNLIVTGNTSAKIINDVNIVKFFSNVIKVDDIISLRNIKFSHNFSSTNIRVIHGPLNSTFPLNSANFNLSSKTISGMLQAYELNTPPFNSYPMHDTPFNYIIYGSLSFETEPNIKAINGINLEELYKEIYTIDKAMNISGINFNIKNMTVKRNSIDRTILYTPRLYSWLNISEILLSKTKSQEIRVMPYFSNIYALNINGIEISSLNSSVAYLNYLFEMSLKKDVPQTVSGNWTFNELKILGNGNLNNDINGMNLITDFVRHDKQQNIVTGEKYISKLIVKHLNGLNFTKFVRNCIHKKNEAPISIKGQKTFTDIFIKNLSLDGKIMGHDIKNVFLKSVPQKISNVKRIKGSIKTPSIILDGLVNDVNITSLVNSQLKKRKSIQKLKSRLVLQDNLSILGNVTIKDSLNGMKLESIENSYKKLDIVNIKLTQLRKVADVIGSALQNRAIYFHKFEIVEDLDIITNESLIESNVLIDDNLNDCTIKNVSLICNDVDVQGFNIKSGLGNHTMIKLISLNGNSFIASIESGCVSIFSFDSNDKQFHKRKDFCIFDILQATVVPIANSMWIILKMSWQMLILRYDQWNDIEQYVLPPSNILVTSKIPTNEFLILRSDGVWKLSELGSPRHIFKTALNGEIKVLTLGAKYYLKITMNNSTKFLEPRYIGA